MNEFQSQGRGSREPVHPLVKMIDFEMTPELQKQIDELRVLWKKQVDNATEMFRTPVIADHDMLDALVYTSSVRPFGEQIRTPSKNPCLEIAIPTQPPKMHYVVYGRGAGSGGPKCECGKDKHGFAFHMRFCPKWEPIA